MGDAEGICQADSPLVPTCNSRLVKIAFWGEAETAIRLGIKSRSGPGEPSTGNTIWGLWSLF